MPKLLLLLLVVAAIFCSASVAATTPSSFDGICSNASMPVDPGTLPVNPGLLWNPQRSGTGWSIAYSPIGGAAHGASQLNVHLIWYTYRADGTPIWYLTDPVTIAPPTSPTIPSFTADLYTYQWHANHPAGARAVKSSSPVGQVRGFFSPNDQSRLALEWRLGANSTTFVPECLIDFSREFHAARGASVEGVEAALRGINLAFNGAYFDPQNSGWGLLQHVIRTNGLADQSLYRESLALALYDDSGSPTWLLGLEPGEPTASPPPLQEWRQIPVSIYLAGTSFNPAALCPTGNPYCRPVSHVVGSWYRNFISSAQLRVALTVEHSERISVRGFDVGLPPPQAGGGEPAQSVLLQRLTQNNFIVVDRAPCVAYPGQVTCHVSINWSVDPQATNVCIRRVEQPSSPQNGCAGSEHVGELDIELNPLEFGLNGPKVLYYELTTAEGTYARTPNLYAVGTAGGDPLSSVADATYPAQEAQVPHSAGLARLPASAGVSGGAATYSIPIDVPPGRRGMQPSVSLEYSSRSGNGVAGMGFSLSVGGSIHRCPMTVEQDGRVRAVTLGNDDRLCLNGQRLVRVEGGVYGSVGAVYATEIDSFVRVTQAGGDLSNPATYFEVRTKEGELHVYGAPGVLGGSGALVRPQTLGSTPIRLAPLHWMLAERRDCVGNVERHIYTTTGTGSTGSTLVEEVLLSEIRYTGHRAVANPANAGCLAPLGGSLTDGTRRVSFIYEARPDTSSSFVGGGVLWQSLRLARVETYAPTTDLPSSPVGKVRKYALRYVEARAGQASGGVSVQPHRELSQSSGRSLLFGIAESAYQDGVAHARAPTQFVWQDGELQVEASKLRDVLQGLPSELHPIRVFGDVNGDGHRDLLAVTEDERTVLVALGADREVLWTVDVTRAIPYTDPISAGLTYPSTHDVDLDGRVDVQALEALSDTSFEHGATRPPARFEVVYRRLADSIGDGGEMDDYFPPNRRIRTGFPTVDLHDLNGDGYLDIVSTSVEGDPTCPSNGNRISIVLNRFGLDPSLDRNSPRADPFNVEKRVGPDASFCLQGSSAVVDRQTLSAVLDLNGDGLLDFALSALPGTEPPERRSLWAQVRLGNVSATGYGVGTLQTYAAFLGGASGPNPWGNAAQGGGFLTADFNGDGLVDLAWPAKQQESAPLTWAFRFGTGSGFSPIRWTQLRQGLVYALTDGGSPTFFMHSGRLRAADTNSDGRDEILFPTSFVHHVCTRNFRDGLPTKSSAGAPGVLPIAPGSECAAEDEFRSPLLLHPNAPQASCLVRSPESFAGRGVASEPLPGEYYYECPEDPLTGHPTHKDLLTAGGMGVVMIDAPEGTDVPFNVVGMYATGLAPHDMPPASS